MKTPLRIEIENLSNGIMVKAYRGKTMIEAGIAFGQDGNEWEDATIRAALCDLRDRLRAL
jgi:hypothetical protein